MRSNEELVGYLLENGFAGAAVAKAMRKVDRSRFVPAEYLNSAYDDIPLPIGHGQTISAPSVVAIMSTELQVEPGMKILEVGTGSGYQAAILAELAGQKGRVISIERIPELAELARTNLAQFGFKNVLVVEGDGSTGYEQGAPFDRIIATAGAPRIPEAWAEQIREGGRIVAPIGSENWQELMVADKVKGELVQRAVLPVMFVPLIGRHGFSR